jgi:hypothetical protein
MRKGEAERIYRRAKLGKVVQMKFSKNEENKKLKMALGLVDCK